MKYLEVSRPRKTGAKKPPKQIYRKLTDTCATHIELQCLQLYLFIFSFCKSLWHARLCELVLSSVLPGDPRLQFCVKHCFMRLHLLLICYETVSLNI